MVNEMPWRCIKNKKYNTENGKVSKIRNIAQKIAEEFCIDMNNVAKDNWISIGK